jgi:hypothetical protein
VGKGVDSTCKVTEETSGVFGDSVLDSLGEEDLMAPGADISLQTTAKCMACFKCIVIHSPSPRGDGTSSRGSIEIYQTWKHRASGHSPLPAVETSLSRDVGVE